MNSIEICAGAGGQALGLELAGFAHSELVEFDVAACATLRKNRPNWLVREQDVRNYSASHVKGIELVAGGVPCPPFSHAGKQLGADDERDLFPKAIRLLDEARPLALMLENVRGLLDPKFREYREDILLAIEKLGYVGSWQLLQASNYGVPQLRPRSILVALKKPIARHFTWPEASPFPPKTVGETLYDLMAANGWRGADEWRLTASGIAPTLVGGSKKHGGADLGPTRAKKAWEMLGVDGKGLANEAPTEDFIGLPRLTLRMTARIQGFPDSWEITGKKTPAYRQVGNAFPPPVAKAVGQQIMQAIEKHSASKIRKAGSK